MSNAVKYDSTKLEIRRYTTVAAYLDEMVLDATELDRDADGYIPLEMASFSYSADYNPDDHGTLIVGSETGAISISKWNSEDDPDLYVGDLVRVRYNGRLLFFGTVETLSKSYSTTAEAYTYGEVFRIDVTANLVGYYGIMMSDTVSWKKLPNETAIHRIRRWVKVSGW